MSKITDEFFKNPEDLATAEGIHWLQPSHGKLRLTDTAVGVFVVWMAHH